MQYDNRVLTQAHLWSGIHDSLHRRNILLEKELSLSKEELRRKEIMYSDAKWTLHELSNGAAHAAIKLYRAGELQERIPYEARNRIQATIWRAEAEMDAAKRLLPSP